MNPLFLVSGPSGSGKTTIMRAVMNNEIVSVTTRKPRPGEIHGRDYYFISASEYTKLEETNALREKTNYGGNRYGITREELQTKLERGPAFLVCDVNGMTTMRLQYENTVAIFIYTDPTSALANMVARGDSQEAAERRLSTYYDEMRNRKFYDYVVRNNYGRLNDTVQIVKSIIQAEID